MFPFAIGVPARQLAQSCSFNLAACPADATPDLFWMLFQSGNYSWVGSLTSLCVIVLITLDRLSAD